MDTGKLIDSMKRVVKSELGSYDTTATVKRVEGNTAWVHIPGGVDETPVRLTMNAKEGDNVQVRVSDGKAFLAGNVSAPPTDDTTAEAAKALANRAAEDAGRAKSAADIAESYATSAQQSAAQSATILDGMEQAAIAAGTTLDGIYADAAEAKATTDEINDYADTAGKTVTQILNDGETAGAAAQAASEAANSALVGLSTVEDVVGVLNWITEHGTMTLTSDVTVNPAHVYFIVDPAGDYVVGGTHYSIVSEPDDADIGTYYELTVDESVENYVATHIVVDTEGLWIIPDAGGNKVLIAVGGAGHTYTTAGTYIVGKVGGVDTVLAEFTASGAQIGQNTGGNVFIDNDSVDIKDGSTVVATFGINGSQIGQNGQSRIIEDAYSMQMIDKGQHSYLKIKDLRGESGIYEFQESFRSDGDTTYYGLSLNAIEEEGVYQINVTFTPSSYHYSGTITRYRQGIEFDPPVPDGCYIHARYKSDSDFCKEYTLGSRRVYGSGSSDQVGPMSTVIGFSNSAEAFASFGEGYDTRSSGYCSHAEGWETAAMGNCSHSQNMCTNANGEAQTSIGKWNIADYNNEYALIIGNGSQGTPSNALTVDWSGNVEAAGDVTDGAGNTLSNKRSAAFVQMYHGNQALNNTARKITGLSISAGGNYSDYFDVGTADQVTIKKTGGYRIDMAMRFSAVTNAGNVKRISLYRNGSEFVVLMSRANSWEDFSTFYTQDLSVGDVLTMYGRSEDGNATASIERIYIEPIP